MVSRKFLTFVNEFNSILFTKYFLAGFFYNLNYENYDYYLVLTRDL